MNETSPVSFYVLPNMTLGRDRCRLVIACDSRQDSGQQRWLRPRFWASIRPRLYSKIRKYKIEVQRAPPSNEESRQWIDWNSASYKLGKSRRYDEVETD
ncbi:MAG: hypothetical protein IPM55_13245 [Acidobacteria bacterium]|nr:hypothetical protein [Acidobacteriota bacterium]